MQSVGGDLLLGMGKNVVHTTRISHFAYFCAAPPSQPLWHNPNASPTIARRRKFNVSLNHTPFESRVSKQAPYAARATLGSTTLAGRAFSPAAYNSLSDPHLNEYFSRKFGASDSLRESGALKPKVCTVCEIHSSH